MKNKRYSANNSNKINSSKSVKSSSNTLIWNLKRAFVTATKWIKKSLQAQEDYQKLASKKQRELARIKQNAAAEKLHNEDVRDHYRKVTAKNKEISERNLKSMELAHREELVRTRAKQTHQRADLQKHHSKNMMRMEQLNQQHLRWIGRLILRGKESGQKKAHHAELDKNRKHFFKLRDRQEKQYLDKLRSEKKFFEDQIVEQRGEYKKIYHENEKMNIASLENQRNNYDEQLFKIRKGFLNTAEFYNHRKDDPFYQLSDLDAQFAEGEAFYEVKVKVPEHEMQNFRVTVQPDKVTLASSRQHEQYYKKQNEKIATNNNQTIRQEFTLKQPAEHEQIVKSYENGILTVTIPKKGFYKFGLGLSTEVDGRRKDLYILEHNSGRKAHPGYG